MSDELRRVLWPKGHRADIWAIVDAAQDQQVYWTLTNSFLPHSCLFAGKLPEALEMAAPYLVQLDPEDKFTNYLGKNLRRNVAVFLQSDASLHELRHHLRTFLTVKDPRGRKMLFRYYDPRVLRVYLPTCSTSELQFVFGPVKAYWAVPEEANALTQFEFRGKDLRVTSQPLGTVERELETVIVAARRELVVPHESAPQPRVPVLLQGAGQGGILRRSAASIRFFRTLSAPEELPFVNGAYTVPASTLEPDVTIYAQAAEAGEVALTLETARGGRAETTLEAVALGLDGGAMEVCAGTTMCARRRLDVVATAFSGQLVLRASGGLTIYDDATAQHGHPLDEGFVFKAPTGRRSFWLEGSVPGRNKVQLSLEGSQVAGAVCAVTVANVELTPEGPVTMLSGGEGTLPLTAKTTPEGVDVRWSVTRLEEDGAAARALSINAVPTLDGASLAKDATGTFMVRATAGDAESGWGGPFREFEVNLVHAALIENRSSVNGRFCGCGREAGTDQFRLHCGNGGVVLEADLQLTGGGADGTRGVAEIRGGWIHAIVSDNAGARYKGGVTRQAKERFATEPAAMDTPTMRARVAPSSQWMVQDGGAIEQIWRYLETRSYLALWPAGAEDQAEALLAVGWSFTGDYQCNATKTTKTIVPARLAATQTVVFPAPTRIEESHDRQDD